MDDLIWRNILPRLTDLEEQVRKLRKATWPYCQGHSESNQLDQIDRKVKFLQELDLDEVKLLLNIKAKETQRGLHIEEYNEILKRMCDNHSSRTANSSKNEPEYITNGDNRLYRNACLQAYAQGLTQNDSSEESKTV